MDNPFLPLFHNIESLDYQVGLGLASGRKLYVEIMTNRPAVIALRESIQSDVALSDHLLERIKWLADQLIDKQFCNPHDDAIATYLWILKADTTDEVFDRAQAILEKFELNLFWARQLFVV